MAKGGSPRDIARHRGDVDITQAVALVAYMSLFFQYAKLRADGRIVWFARHASENFRDGGSFKLIENVHDLAFAAGEDLDYFFHLPIIMLFF
jgi:hypothetical protein